MNLVLVLNLIDVEGGIDMTVGDLRLGMPLNLDDPTVISRYNISNIRSAVSNTGRSFQQFYFGPDWFDTKDLHISEGIVVNGVVDMLSKTWVWPWRTEEEMQKGFQCLSALFGEMHDKHRNELVKHSQFIQCVYSPGMDAGIRVYPNNTAMAVQQAIMFCLQQGQRALARVVFCEDNDLNTVYTLEMHSKEAKFQFSEVIILRN